MYSFPPVQFLSGHISVLQSRVSTSAPSHSSPPLDAGGSSGVRDLLCTPPPHVTEHSVHDVQVFHSQSIGHTILLQFASSCCVSLQLLVRVRSFIPVPHDCEQSPHSPHGVQLQTSQPSSSSQ